MIGDFNQDYLLFDGDCGICNYSAEWIKRHDRQQRFVVEPYQLSSEAALAKVGLSYEKCSKKAWLVTRSGRTFGGAFAINGVLFKLFPWSLLVIAVYLIPPFLLAEIAGYYLVAKNRHRLSRWFGLTACLISNGQSPRSNEPM